MTTILLAAVIIGGAIVISDDSDSTDAQSVARASPTSPVLSTSTTSSTTSAPATVAPTTTERPNRCTNGETRQNDGRTFYCENGYWKREPDNEKAREWYAQGAEAWWQSMTASEQSGWCEAYRIHIGRGGTRDGFVDEMAFDNPEILRDRLVEDVKVLDQECAA